MSSLEPNGSPRGLAVTTREAFVQLQSFAGRGPRRDTNAKSTAPAEAVEVVKFWSEAGPNRWFAKDGAFDHRFRQRYIALHEKAARGALDDWMSTAAGALALLLLLDQFPRNAFRGTARMYATDAKARSIANAAIKKGFDQSVEEDLRLFFYLPFAHSENLADQDRSVELSSHLAEPSPSHARRHRSIVWRFGRFPHRNPLLGRTMLPEEQRYLDDGGYAG